MAETSGKVLPETIDGIIELLSAEDYMAARPLATVLFLALRMKRPLFLEGEAGVGKTEVAKVLAKALDRPLIRLQCYEGLDVASAVYEWNYPAQMLEIRMAEASGVSDRSRLESDIFSERYLIRRPVLQALEGQPGRAPIFLIDELDRTDEAFEAFLLEVLSDAIVAFDCMVTDRKVTNTHTVLFGEVKAVHFGAREPSLIYLDRGYRTL